MIANLKIPFLIGLMVFLCTNVLAKPVHFFKEITEKFNVNPPEILHGYPLSYQKEIKNPTGIIYLSNSIEYLEKLDSRTYAGKPTDENALIISQLAYKKGLPTYYLIVDTSLSFFELTYFIEKLGENVFDMNIFFVGKNATYIPVRYNNVGYFLANTEVISCGGNYNKWTLLINSLNGLLFENQIIQEGELTKEIRKHYGHNLGIDNCMNCPVKHKITPKDCLKNIEFCKSQLGKNKEVDFYFTAEILKWKNYLYLLIEEEELFELSNSFKINMSVQNYTRLDFYYLVLSNIQQGVFLARNDYSIQKWQKSYPEILWDKNGRLNSILNITFPDRIVIQYNKTDGLTSLAPPETIIIIE